MLDEIQECPNARTAIKFLVQDGRCAWAETSSMLGVNMPAVKSYPVGFESIYHMCPLDFEEFLWAIGTSTDVIDYMQQCYEKLIPLKEAVHQTMLTAFQRYLVVGGMPEAVVSFVEKKMLPDVEKIHKKIIDLYRSDITKYAEKRDYPKILDIFDAIPSQLDKKNQRFMLSQVIPGARLQKIQSCYLWLIYAGIGLPCYNVAEPQAPLKLNENRSLFKLFFLDPGLLTACSLNSVQFQLLQGNLEINQGSVLENAAACQLKANGFDLFYFNSKKIGELDFLIHYDDYPDLLEIKSVNNWTKHPAMNNALAVKSWKFNRAMVFCKGNISSVNEVVHKQTDTSEAIVREVIYLPYYLLMFLKPDSFVQRVAGELEPLNMQDLTKYI